MTNPNVKPMPANILVYLPEAAGGIVAELNEEGYGVSHVSSQADLHCKLQAVNFDVVVTTRRNIDMVRRVRPLPVVNIEIFFNPASARPTSGPGSQLDMAALSRKINALVHRRSPPVVAPAAASTVLANQR